MDLDEVAHYEPPHQDLRCFANLAIFVSGTLKRVKFLKIGTPKITTVNV